MDVSKFTDKLNKSSSRNHVIEEVIEVTGGIYEAELIHDNINKKTVNIYTGSKLTGTKIDAFALSIPSSTPWRTIIKIFTDASPVYISYETPGDTVEAADINSVQDAIVYTQEETNKEVDRLDRAIEDETDRAKAEEKIINENLTAEIKRSKDAEKVLTDNLSTEVARAKKTEQDITDNLNTEITRAKEAEKIFDDNLADETIRAKAEEKILTDNLSTEVSRAMGTETAITNNLNSEITRAKATETTLTNNLNAEVARALSAESNIDSKKADKSAVEQEFDKRYTKEQTFTKDEILQKIQNVIGTAPEALDTLKEISDALNNDPNFAATMTTELSKKATNVDLTNHINNKSNPHGITAAQVGLDKVPNVPTNDQAPTYTESSSLTNVVSGEKLSISFGKIMKAISALIAHIADTVSHITSTERTNWNIAKTHADSAHAPSNAQANIIETIQKNGTAITPTNKAVNITVPVKISELTNDSGFIANDNTKLPLAGGTMSGMLYFSNNVGGIQGTIGTNDFYRIIGRETASNAGYLEIATADDGTEPIYFRQYTGTFVTLVRTLTLLDGSGNSSFPGTVTAPAFSGALNGNAATATKLKPGATWNDLKGV